MADEQPSSNEIFEKVKKYAKEHQDELLCAGAGLLCGIFVTRFIYERNLRYTTNQLNEHFKDIFMQNKGNFQMPDGTYPIPQLVKT